ncbi:MAG: flippase-like domain-containing protein [Chloroflexota bacterium]|nr:flippase-like domain-containing protein [Chloroflexota bacterium]
MADSPSSRVAGPAEPFVVASPETAREAGQLSLARQLLKPQTLLSFAVSFGIILFVFIRQDIPFARVWQNIRSANLLLLALGFAAYYATFYVRMLRWRQVLCNAVFSRDLEHTIPSHPRLTRIIVLSWFANSILPAKLGDGYRAYLLKRASGISFYKTMGTILAERIADVGVLFSLLLASALLAFRQHFPPHFGTLVGFGASLAVLSLSALFLFRFLSPYLVKVLPISVRPHYSRLEHGLLLAFSQRLWEIVLLTALVWLLESARFGLVAASLGQSLNVWLVVFVALTASLLTTVPFTPAGLGVVEGAVVAALMLVIDDRSVATSIALLDRVVTYWALIIVGSLLYMFTRDY